MRYFTTVLLAGLLAVTILAAGADRPFQAFSGTYDWKDGGSDELTAEFTRAAEGNWKVKFRFRFNGKRESWKGTATGSLDDGETISGTAEANGRNWVFEGATENSVLRGSHTEIRRDRTRHDTGTFELKR